ncbi:aspartic proteinase [Grosmannia clavigera kw1407]|uniref:Aspartic proteinase n=1 Tax=Grosmannia clavigera (strain kw1407 / UAMH 11150) TaxID=655863 RepID=F0X7D3_GROCL|nr:aspartic proteinase [Grosmannia clavigera kw1407]EFX06615.1 aspartic proteinase [Grosmannia clavigera kw1407]
MMLQAIITSAVLVMGALAKPAAFRDSSLPHPLKRTFDRRNDFSSGGTFSVDLVRNNAYKNSGPIEYAKAYAKYGKSFAEQMQSKFQLPAGSVAAINQSYDREYLSPVYLGTPGQLCWLDLDTGSADLWLFSSDTPSFYLDGQQIYHPEKSHTAIPVENVTWAITYGDGSYAGGAVYRDTVSLGNITLLNATVESATAVSRSLTTDAVMSGILGLSLNHSSTTYPHQPTLLQALAPPVLDRYVFAADLRYKAPGSYHFGYINESAYTGTIAWNDVLQRSTFWEFYVQSVHFGGDKVWRLHNWPMVADTGTSLLLLPSDVTALYWSLVPGAYQSDSFFGWVFPCNATLPSFDFGFSSGWNASIPGHYFNFENVSTTECYGGIQDSMETFGILGDAFLKALYVVFDVSGSRVGLATKTLLA